MTVTIFTQIKNNFGVGKFFNTHQKGWCGEGLKTKSVPLILQKFLLKLVHNDFKYLKGPEAGAFKLLRASLPCSLRQPSSSNNPGKEAQDTIVQPFLRILLFCRNYLIQSLSIIQVSHLETLAELTAILRGEVIGQHCATYPYLAAYRQKVICRTHCR